MDLKRGFLFWWNVNSHIFLGESIVLNFLLIFRLKCGPYGTTQHWTCSLLHTHANALFLLMPILFLSHVVDWTGKERDHSVTTYCISCIRRKSSHSNGNNKRWWINVHCFLREMPCLARNSEQSLYIDYLVYLCVRTSVCLAMWREASLLAYNEWNTCIENE